MLAKELVVQAPRPDQQQYLYFLSTSPKQQDANAS